MARETPQLGDGEPRGDKGHKRPTGTEEHRSPLCPTDEINLQKSHEGQGEGVAFPSDRAELRGAFLVFALFRVEIHTNRK